MPTRFLKRLASITFGPAITLSGTCAASADKHDGKVSTAAADIKHVFVIMLENKSFSDTFGTSTQDPYLQQPWCRWAAC
jgi:phospholipase C